MNADAPFNTVPPTRIAVVGGGLSGLAAAHRLIELADERQCRFEVELFESGPRLGGVIETRRIGDYLVELGADSFVTNKPWAVSLCERLGLGDRLISTNELHRRSLVLRKGRLIPTPEGFTLLAPSQMWSVLRTSLLSPWGKVRMGLEYFVPRKRSDGEESLAQFVRRRFGREALERLAQPMVGGIYTSDPEKLSLEATMPQFLEMEREHGSLIRALRKSPRAGQGAHSASGARYGLFVTLQNGMSELLSALETRVRGVAAIHTNRKITGITYTHGLGFELRDAQGVVGGYQAVILALPTYRVAELVRPRDTGLAGSLDCVEYASTAIVASGHRLQDVSGVTDAFGFVVPAVERRRILAVSFSSRKFPGRAPEGRILLRTFVGGAMQPELLDRDDAALQELVRQELADLLGVGGVPDFSVVTRYSRAMPQYHVGHRGRVRAIESRLGNWPGLQLAGNAYYGVGMPDSIHSGELAAERALDACS